MKSSSDSTHMLAHLSDKFHYVVSFFSDKSLGNFARYVKWDDFYNKTFIIYFRKHPNWSIMEIQGAIIRLLEYRIVKVSCSGDSEVGDSVVLVVEEFEHVGSDGSSVFGDPRYVPINPAVRTSLQRPAPPSPSKKEGAKSQEYSFTQSLDPTDLLFLESTCTQTFQRQFITFPQVISDSDWKIPADQIKILDGILLIKFESFEYEAGSDVELSEDEFERAKRTKVTFPLTQTSSPIRGQVSSATQISQNQYPATQMPSQISQNQYPATQMPSQISQNQYPATQMPYTQAPMTQASSQLLSTQTQSPLRAEPVIFPETQLLPSSNSAVLGVTQSSPHRISKEMINNHVISPIRLSSPMKSSVKDSISSPTRNRDDMSSPIRITNNIDAMDIVMTNATPVKFSVFESQLVSEVIKTTIEAAEIPSSPINSPVKKSSVALSEVSVQKLPEPVIDYPDYSSW
jgi:hypothetical protein